VHVRRIEAAMAATLDAMGRHAKGALGRVRIGTGATACIHLLPPVLRELRRKFPSLELTVTTGHTGDIVRFVEEHVLDIGLVTLPARRRALSVTPVLEDEFVAIASPDAPALPTPLTPEALAALPIVLYEAGAQTRRLVDQWCARAGVTLKPVMELGSVEAIKELVGAGLGCGVLPAMAVSNAKRRGDLAIHSLTPRLWRSLGLVLRRDRRLDQGLREVLDALTALAPAIEARV
jgi:DNA-binding transcriptional LysR family regulator